MIVDVCLFYNEFTLLELRLKVLRAFVDKFVVVRGDRTFRGQPIPANVGAALRALSQDLDFTVCVVELPARTDSPWQREHLQRNAITRCLSEIGALPDGAVVLVSDVDEIPKPESISLAAEMVGSGAIACFRQLHSYFALNLVDDEPWFGTRAIAWRELLHTEVEAIRNVSHPGTQTVIEDGGWHFGWTGGNESVRQKLAAFSHEELDRPEFSSDARLDACVTQRVTLHNGHRLTPVSLERMPREVRENPGRYAHLLAPE